MSTPLPILKEQIEDYLSKSLATDIDQATLESSMAYSLMAGGKRLRPALTLTTIEMLGGTLNDDLLRAASALELLHTYSLIHDDLPAMDNDDLRRTVFPFLPYPTPSVPPAEAGPGFWNTEPPVQRA